MPQTTAADVLALLDLLKDIGVDAIVAGGWGVDALIGRETREHEDLDVAIPAESEEVALLALQAAGYSVTADWRPVRVQLSHPNAASIDVHPLRYREDGGALQAGLDGVEYEYPADGFTTGVINKRTVRCITASLQALFHTGYVPQPKDEADMTALMAATGVRWPIQ